MKRTIARLRKPPYNRKEMAWVHFQNRARMKVWVCGGPIHAPHEEILQLFIEPWDGDYESWTVYRHETDRSKAGKLVFKKWDSAADKKRFPTLKIKTWRQAFHAEVNVTEKHYPLSSRWVSNLQRAVEDLSIPPITGPVQPLSRATEYRLSFWRGPQRSQFRWHVSPPTAWKPLGRLFDNLVRNFRDHANGKELARVNASTLARSAL